MSEELNDNERGTTSGVLSAVLSVAILGTAVGIAVFTFFTEPTAERGGAAKKTAMLVDVVEVDRDDHHPEIVAQGTVEPARDVVLRPQVGGRVISISDSFAPGGYVEQGEQILQIESEDFRHTLAQRKSELRQAEADLAVAEGRRDAAEAEYEYLGEDEIPPKNKELLLQKPQLDAAEEDVKAARAAVDQAQLELERTTVEAPFDAHILRRDVNVGSQISPNDSITRLVGTETYWVSIELPLSKMRWVTVGDEERAKRAGSEVRVRNRGAWPEGVYRTGSLFRRVGALDEGTRMVRLLASIPDPLAREEPNRDKPPLVIGEFVEATIQGRQLEDVVRLDREYVRKNDTVWTMQDGELQINDVEIVLQNAKHAYISSGLEDGAQVVTTNISTVVEGADLKRNDDDGEQASSQSEEGNDP